MGSLTYDSVTKVDFDDRILAHFQVVIGLKLRRGESFYFSWKDDLSIGGGRTSIWLHPAIALKFKFQGGRSVQINTNWIEELLVQANASGGLRPSPEPR